MEKEFDNELQELMTAPEPVTDATGVEMDEWCFTNDKSNPAIRHLFRMFYESVMSNKIGVMHALNTETNKIETIIVGIELSPAKEVMTWPIAKVLTEEQQGCYKAPDGSGNYL